MSRSVMITGVLGGIGQGIAKVFAESGYHVIGIDVKSGSHAYGEVFQMDIGRFAEDAQYMTECLGRLEAALQDLHALINNAAVQLLNPLENQTLADWNTTLNTNLTAPMLLSQWAVPLLAPNQGSIINIASIHEQLTKPRFIAYATSKSALVGLTKSMAVDLAGKVRVNAISPAAIETAMLKAGFDNDESAIDELRKLHPVQRIGYPEEVAKLALFLASEEAGFINGANLSLDGGISSVLNDL